MLTRAARSASAKRVLQLLGASTGDAPRAPPRELVVAGRRLGTLEKDAAGAVTVRLAAGALDAAKEHKLHDFLLKCCAVCRSVAVWQAWLSVMRSQAVTVVSTLAAG